MQQVVVVGKDGKRIEFTTQAFLGMWMDVEKMKENVADAVAQELLKQDPSFFDYEADVQATFTVLNGLTAGKYEYCKYPYRNDDYHGVWDVSGKQVFKGRAYNVLSSYTGN